MANDHDYHDLLDADGCQRVLRADTREAFDHALDRNGITAAAGALAGPDGVEYVYLRTVRDPGVHVREPLQRARARRRMSRR